MSDARVDAAIDPATGLGNRAALDVAASALIAIARRSGRTLCLVAIKLRDAEDALTRDRSMSLALRACLRGTDQVFRIHDDTLVALLPMADRESVGKAMDRVARLAETFYWGSAVVGTDGWSVDELLAKASKRVRVSR